MASIKKLQPGQTVWSIVRQKMGNTALSYGALYSIVIHEVHESHVIASFNSNPPRRYDLSAIKKWKVSKPEAKRKIWGTDSYL